MANKYSCTINDLFNMFSDVLNPEDVLTSKLIAQISSAITQERINLNMNQTEFADYIDASQSLVSRWEHGNYNFSLKKLAEIAVKLNLDVNINISKNVTESSHLQENKRNEKIIQFPKKTRPVFDEMEIQELEEM